MNHKFESHFSVSCCLLIVSLLGGLKTSPAEAGESYAFLVAVGDYDVKHLKPLAYTRNDILEFRTLLLKSGFSKQNIVLLHDDLKQLSNQRYIPNAEEIRKEFTLLVSGLEPDDTLIVAMAGHGVQFKDDKNSYFCPADADLDDEKHDRLISFKELYEGLEQCEARKKLLLIDACRNDPQSQLSRSRAKIKLQSITRPQSEPVPEGIVALFSCSAGEQAYEWPDLKHGIFFHHVLEGWKGAADDGDLSLSLDELVAYTRKKTQTFARLKLGSIQRPQRLGEFSGTWKLCELEDPDYELGLKLYLGDGMQMDRGRAFQLFRKAADRGHTLAKSFVGLEYAYGVQVPKNLDEGIRWYESALPALQTLAEEGHPVAQTNLGELYSQGFFVSKDEKQAVEWYRKAAEQKDARAEATLGRSYLYGQGIKQDNIQALYWIRKSTAQNFAPAFTLLGMMYRNGQGVDKDLGQAVKFFTKAAEKNYAKGQTVLGLSYQYGYGVDTNISEAVKWIQKSANQGEMIGQYNLGVYYANGRGVPRDQSEAVKWYRLSAEQGYVQAQYNLGFMYYNGLGVDKDLSEAAKWYLSAAEQGSDKAQNDIGYMYDKGLGVEQNTAAAVKWYRKAAQQGNKQAVGNMKSLGYNP